MILSPAIVVALLIATAAPLVFLAAVRSLDLYATGAFRTVVACFVWGLIAFGAALLISQAALGSHLVGQEPFQRFWSPIIEEVLKSLFLLIVIRRATFTYFVDGAIDGFAVGVGFAIAENYYYLYSNPGAAVGLAAARVLSANLVHAAGSALVGTALGRSRFSKPPASLAVPLLGCALAIALHAGYNNLVIQTGGSPLLVAALIGCGAAACMTLTIRHGLADERAWIEETLAHDTGVTTGEKALVNRLSETDKLLAPLAKRFGPHKAGQVERFLVLQAQMGIKRKMAEKIADDRLSRAVEAEIAGVRAEMDIVRRSVGAYVMVYVRTIFPEGGSPVFGRLETILSERSERAAPPGGPDAFALLGGRLSMAASRPISNKPGDPNG